MKVQDILTDESKWCQMAWFLDTKGRQVLNHRDAVKFCLQGAFQKAYAVGELQPWLDARKKLQEKIGSAIDWNDHPSRTFAEVRALIVELDI